MQIGALVLICIIAIFFLLKSYFRIPSIEVLKNLMNNTNIQTIIIYSKFSRLSGIKITNNIIPPNHVLIPVDPKKAKAFWVIRSKMVGTFYIIDSKTGQPYITIGQTINPGDQVGHIISINITTEIISEYYGTVTEILSDNHTPVEYGQAIIHVQPI